MNDFELLKCSLLYYHTITMKHTKEEVKEYYNSMREKWREAKQLSQSIEELDREDLLKVQMSVPTMSATWFMFCRMQMRNLWLEWLPWIDCKTFKGRKDFWFRVKKWETSKITGLTWVRVGDEDDSYVYPKIYHLFHTSQVEPLYKTADEKNEYMPDESLYMSK